MANHSEIFVAIDDSTDQIVEYFTNQADRDAFITTAKQSFGIDLYGETRDGSTPLEITSRALEDDEYELAMETVKLSDLSRTARTQEQFKFVLGFSRALARDFLYRCRPIPPAVAKAADAARKALRA